MCSTLDFVEEYSSALQKLHRLVLVVIRSSGQSRRYQHSVNALNSRNFSMEFCLVVNVGSFLRDASFCSKSVGSAGAFTLSV